MKNKSIPTVFRVRAKRQMSEPLSIDKLCDKASECSQHSCSLKDEGYIGKFIVIEGLEGAGKTTAMQTVSQELGAKGIEHVITREPGGTLLAEKLRDIIKHHPKQEPLNPKTELLLLYAARLQLVETVIKPALKRGIWVIGDRHDLSTQAYQGGGRGIDSHILNVLREEILGDFSPDLTLYLDIPPELGLERARARGKLDRIEQSDLYFFKRTHQRYRELAAQNPKIQTIDATRDLETVTADVQKTLQIWFSEQKS